MFVFFCVFHTVPTFSELGLHYISERMILVVMITLVGLIERYALHPHYSAAYKITFDLICVHHLMKHYDKQVIQCLQAKNLFADCKEAVLIMNCVLLMYLVLALDDIMKT